MYVLDTNVLSELRKGVKGEPQVIAWARPVDSSLLYLSVISILELTTGQLLLERRDRMQADILRRWIETYLLPGFAGRILPVDTAVAQRCAALHVPDPKAERDALIAATALVHGMVVVTRNVKDFAPMKVDLLNPWVEGHGG